MNCFHFSVSLGYKTTKIAEEVSFITLWIAFIFQYLWDTKQHHQINADKSYRCELLSFFSIFGIQNNKQCYQPCRLSVVNCFHFSVSLGYKTTVLGKRTQSVQLWIAFIFQYLWDTKQQYIEEYNKGQRCELLSFFSIFGIQNNITGCRYLRSPVVNCFHFSVSLGYKTTLFNASAQSAELWIAFIFQYLWDTKQLY